MKTDEQLIAEYTGKVTKIPHYKEVYEPAKHIVPANSEIYYNPQGERIYKNLDRSRINMVSDESKLDYGV